MNKTLRQAFRNGLIMSFGLAFVLYITGVFISLEIDVLKWSEGARLFLSVPSLSVFLFFFFGVLFQEEPKGRPKAPDQKPGYKPEPPPSPPPYKP